jgi:RNA polymerase sigma factor for flagellar operon FliA
VQLAYTGLLEALDRFDLQYGTPFRAFAAHRISGSIRDGIARMTEVREQISWRNRVRRERMASLANIPSDQMGTSDAMAKMAEIAVGLALGFMLEGTGLFEHGESADGVPHSRTGYESLAWKEIVDQLHVELSALPEREHTILRQHYIDGMSFDHLSTLLAVSKGRISQMHRGALNRLRKRMRERGHFRLER